MAGDSRRPDFDVVVSRKRGEDKFTNTRVGAGWKQDNGSIAVRLEKGIGVSTPDGVFLTLFVKREKNEDGGSERGDRRRDERSGGRRGDRPRGSEYDDGGDRR